jgi:hypothetical protein
VTASYTLPSDVTLVGLTSTHAPRGKVDEHSRQACGWEHRRFTPD